MDYQPLELPDKIRQAGYTLAERQAKAELEEEKKKIVFAELCNLSVGSVAAKEKAAYADAAYLKQVEAMIDARRSASMAKAFLEGLRVQLDVWRTIEATERAANRS